MKEVLQGIAQILGHIQSWRGFRGAIVFIVDIATTQISTPSIRKCSPPTRVS